MVKPLLINTKDKRLRNFFIGEIKDNLVKKDGLLLVWRINRRDLDSLGIDPYDEAALLSEYLIYCKPPHWLTGLPTNLPLFDPRGYTHIWIQFDDLSFCTL